MHTLYQQPEVRDYLQRQMNQINPKGIPGAQVMFRPGDREFQIPYMAGNAAGSVAPKVMAPVGDFLGDLGHDVTGTTMKGLALGGLLGAGLGALRGGGIGRSALLGAGGAGLLVYLLNRAAQMRDANLAQTKSAFYGLDDNAGPDPIQLIETKLFSDPNLSMMQQSALSRLLPQLNPSQARTLAALVRSAAGGGVGYIVAKFLLGLGFTGTTLLSLAGAYAGFLSGGLPENAYGQKVDTSTDVFGRKRIV